MTHHYWSDRIPREISQEIGDAIKRQSSRLPPNLFAEWFSPVRLQGRVIPFCKTYPHHFLINK
ncbi:hypothetical protein [Coleofasciculus sp. FACHB-T130]|uniref:hypothetical protein n=1 Tax=Cyanophyceae TaxID=3028117 RepID=UPI001687F4DA|nr:hypothetical protein [Coleofasciculus sp. FACHB-T130]MBD1878378.1 hypothetical protein [Coleofasciculus sp. FACHB-T130]